MPTYRSIRRTGAFTIDSDDVSRIRTQSFDDHVLTVLAQQTKQATAADLGDPVIRLVWREQLAEHPDAAVYGAHLLTRRIKAALDRHVTAGKAVRWGVAVPRPILRSDGFTMAAQNVVTYAMPEHASAWTMQAMDADASRSDVTWQLEQLADRLLVDYGINRARVADGTMVVTFPPAQARLLLELLDAGTAMHVASAGAEDSALAVARDEWHDAGNAIDRENRAR